MTTQFAYDGDGARTSKTASGDTTQYVLDLAATLPVVISDTEAVYLYWLDIIAQQQSERLYYVHDGLGSVRQLLDTAGQIETNYAYGSSAEPLAWRLVGHHSHAAVHLVPTASPGACQLLMNTTRGLRIPVALCGLVVSVLACACPPGLGRYYPLAEEICLEAPYSAPPSSFEESDLLGTWQARYEPGLDTLYIRDDGTFRQVYENHYTRDYIFETPWSDWWLQRFDDGRVRIHLEGARYYLGGIAEGELDGFWPAFPARTPGTITERSTLPYPFVDPFTRERVQMPRELVVAVRVDSSGDILLHHMWDNPDAGFALSGCWREHFRRLGPP